MTLTVKDLYTTVLALGTAGLAYFTLKGFQVPYITNFRLGTLALLVLGIVMCANSTLNPTAGMTAYTVFAGALGVAALVIGIIGLITGTKLAFMTLAGIVLVLWGVATIKHLIGA